MTETEIELDEARSRIEELETDLAAAIEYQEALFTDNGYLQEQLDGARTDFADLERESDNQEERAERAESALEQILDIARQHA